MELFESEDHYILQDGDHALWCDRRSGLLDPKTGGDICSAWNPVCLGKVHGIIGKIQVQQENTKRLLLIRDQVEVGKVLDHMVYRITKIALLPLTTDPTPNLDLERCAKHHFGIKPTEKIVQKGQPMSVQKTWNQIKNVAENVKPKKKDSKDKDRLERKILEELEKMFADNNSFYYSPGGDLTNTVQRQHSDTYTQPTNIRDKFDTRFFWNFHMLQDLISSQSPLADRWIVPIIQGFVQVKACVLDFDENHGIHDQGKLDSLLDHYNICIVSRRSRYRAGTRYKRRGLDADGHCANYVETEQIVEFASHKVAFVQVRGSVPVYWSQTGSKYRPPPKIDKGKAHSLIL
ncbi:unnamed protein product [Owenia fusiformis]|uniref:SAC domain-containing protein n=1 Tax=Owenia fusiformis TaxID=6347 RepID=A0A8S4NSP3_OWEFU|nr:unnamed protein product [Owenia fusiformis]